MKNLDCSYHLCISLLTFARERKPSIVMLSLYSLTLVLMNVTWILNDFHIKREKNDCGQKSGNTLLSLGEFLAGTPLSKLSNESLL